LSKVEISKGMNHHKRKELISIQCRLIILLASIVFVSCKENHHQHLPRDPSTADSARIAELFTKAKSNKDSGTVYLKQAAAIAHNNTVKIQAIYLAMLGKEFIYSGRLDAADSIANIGLQLNYTKKDIGYKGKFYNIKGNVASYKKKIYQSIEYYLYAEKIFELANDSAALAGIYSNIANCYFSLKDYPSAHQFATKAYGLLPSVKEPNITSNIITTFAVSLNKVGRNHEALPFVKKADSLADATHNKMAKLAASIGLAEVFNSLRQYDSATKYYNVCIAESRNIGVKHFELIAQMGLLAMYEEQAKTKEILSLSNSIIALANEQHNTDVLHTVKRIRGKALAKEGDYQTGFQMLQESYALYDSVAGVENQKNINELLVKYDAEKKEKEILNQNLQLATQESKLRSTQIVILALVLILAIFSVIYFYVRKLNRERLLRLEIEKQKKIGDAYIHGEQKERARLAFEIHDGIASMLTGISYKLRAEDANKEEVLALLSGLHEDTRRISHSLMPIDFEQKNLVEAVNNLCERMNTNETEILFFSDTAVLSIDKQKSLLLYRLIQELINNALKYAQCQSVFVRIKTKDRSLIEISVEDDGLGLSEHLIQTGLRSIKERVKSLHATIDIDSKANEGTTIKIITDYEKV
jgi:signal transduction histidine kinase